MYNADYDLDIKKRWKLIKWLENKHRNVQRSIEKVMLGITLRL